MMPGLRLVWTTIASTLVCTYLPSFQDCNLLIVCRLDGLSNCCVLVMKIVMSKRQGRLRILKG